MSHTPPVPPENQSPFPIQEPPHAPNGQAASAKTEAPAALVATATETGSGTSSAPDGAKATSPSQDDGWAMPEAKRGWSLGRIVGAAAGVGAIAIGVAAVLFPRGDKPEPKKKARKN